MFDLCLCEYAGQLFVNLAQTGVTWREEPQVRRRLYHSVIWTCLWATTDWWRTVQPAVGSTALEKWSWAVEAASLFLSCRLAMMNSNLPFLYFITATESRLGQKLVPDSGLLLWHSWPCLGRIVELFETLGWKSLWATHVGVLKIKSVKRNPGYRSLDCKFQRKQKQSGLYRRYIWIKNLWFLISLG